MMALYAWYRVKPSEESCLWKKKKKEKVNFLVVFLQKNLLKTKTTHKHTEKSDMNSSVKRAFILKSS